MRARDGAQACVKTQLCTSPDAFEVSCRVRVGEDTRPRRRVEPCRRRLHPKDVPVLNRSARVLGSPAPAMRVTRFLASGGRARRPPEEAPGGPGAGSPYTHRERMRAEAPQASGAACGAASRPESRADRLVDRDVDVLGYAGRHLDLLAVRINHDAASDAAHGD